MPGSSFPLSKAYFVALFCEAALHGSIFTVLAGGALFLLLRKRNQRKQQTEMDTKTNTIMLLLTALMYGLSTVHIALSLRQNLIAFFDQHAAEGASSILNDQGNPIVYVQIALEVVNCLIGDSIVCWRAWVLWGRDYRIIIPPVLCIVGGLASGIGVVHAFAVSPPGQEVYNEDITNWVMCFGALTCAANIYCVIAISYRAWTTFRSLRRHSPGVVIHGGKYHGALLVIVESGVLYCIALIIAVILFASDNNGVYVIVDMLGHLTGIYPTIIIVLVSLKMTFHDDITHAEQTMTTFQAQGGIGTLNTTVDLRRRGRGVDESEETENTFVLEPFTQRTTQDLRGMALTDSSAKRENVV
ncbi:hypothetical protein LXA43DRAFT_955783 [Ganoderma leucocontextum]|nr:hypothetical protein LXA43DRAFT_955783 [Ganoderma leucocontextum]